MSTTYVLVYQGMTKSLKNHIAHFFILFHNKQFFYQKKTKNDHYKISFPHPHYSDPNQLKKETNTNQKNKITKE